MKNYSITIWQEANSGLNAEPLESNEETTKKQAIKTAKIRLLACKNADYAQIINNKIGKCITIERNKLK